jgi:hypothetical protein
MSLDEEFLEKEMNDGGLDVTSIAKASFQRFSKATLTPINTGQKKKPRCFGNDPFAYYQAHYVGVDRSTLSKRDPGLYNRLWKDGTLTKVPDGSRRYFGDDPLAYCHEHYPNITRGKLLLIDPNLDKKLRRDGLIDKIPQGRRNFGDRLEFYRANYNGLTRGKLGLIDVHFYNSLRKSGELQYIPTQVKL